MATAKSIGEITSALLRPSLTSKFSVSITNPSVLDNFFNGVSKEEFHMSCSEASLP